MSTSPPSTPPATLRLGTRGSKLAMTQTRMVAARLQASWPELVIEIVPIRTTGDAIQDRPLAEIGGKGLFAREIERALLDGAIDAAVHSLKDLETWLPRGLAILCVPERADPHDVLITRSTRSVEELHEGAVLGTSSLRRAAQLRGLRPDLEITGLRGNVETRLARVAEGGLDATLLAAAGLDRLGLNASLPAGLVATRLPATTILPAVGQGALAIEAREYEAGIAALFEPLHCRASAACVTAERAMLAALDGSCRTPIGGLATLQGDRLHLAGLLIAPDGVRRFRAFGEGSADEAGRIGDQVGQALRQQGGEVLDELGLRPASPIGP